MLVIKNVSVSDLKARLETLERPLMSGTETGYSLKYSDGTMINVCRVSFPPAPVATNIKAEALWHTPFKKLMSVSYSLHSLDDGGNIRALGESARTGYSTSTCTLTKCALHGYTYQEPIDKKTNFTVTAIGTWK